MRIVQTSLGLLFAIAVIAEDVGVIAEPREVVGSPQIISAPVTPVREPPGYEEGQPGIEEREVIADPNAMKGPTQLNPTTTLWQQTTLAGGKVVTVPTLFIQSFAAVPDQWPLPMSGAIGLGTLSSENTVSATATVNSRSLNARSEGTLGQTPWIGMAVGLACTTFAAIMLG
jgi:hypothetical protein